MVPSPDPYRFMVTQSFVSPSQEETLKHIPGWDDAKFNDSLTPSQPPLPQSQQHSLLASIRAARSDSDDPHSSSDAPPPTTTFGLHGPLQWVSPDSDERKEVDSYNAAFESDRSQSPGSPRVWGAPIGAVGDLFSARFETQPGIAAEHAFVESQPSAFKRVKTSDGKLEIARPPTGHPIGDLLAIDSVKFQGESFRIRELAVPSDAPVAADMQASRNAEKLYSRKNPRKKTVVQKRPKALQQKQPNLNPRSREPSPPAEARDHSNDVRSGLRLNAGKSGREKEHEELAVERAGIKGAILRKMASHYGISDFEKPQDAVHVQKEALEGSRKDSASKHMSTLDPSLSASAHDRAGSSAKRTAEQGQFAPSTSTQKLKALKQGSGEQDQSRFHIITAQSVPAISKKVASQQKSQETKQTESIIQKQETAIKDNLKDNPVEPGKHKEAAPIAESPEETCLNTSKQAVGAKTKITTSRIGRIGMAENCHGVTDVKGIDKQQSIKGKDIRDFPESVMDVVMYHSGCLPPCGPSDPDFLSLVMSTGVSLPLRSCHGKGRYR